MRFIPIALAAAALAACSQSERDSASPSPEAGSAVESPAAAAQARPLSKAQAQALMKQRHDDYEKIGDAMKIAGRELKRGSPDLAKVRQSANYIAGVAPKTLAWFPAGTGPDVGKTDAKAEIWQKPADFRAKHAAFVKAANAFQAAARGNDLAAMRSAQGSLGASCKACHELYREDH